jgi:hypothetical protein
MFQKNGDFSKSDLERMLRSPEAQALLARLQQLDQAALQNAVDKAFRGDTAGAKEALSPLLGDRQVQQLSEQMRDGHG